MQYKLSAQFTVIRTTHTKWIPACYVAHSFA